MKRRSFLIFCLTGLSALYINCFAQKRFPENIYSFIENPGITQVNQEAGRSPFVPFTNLQQAMLGNKEKSGSFLSLNGDWKFNWFENYEQSSKTFYSTGFNDQQWNTIKVPSNWEMQGFGDPMFRNIHHPFEANPPFVSKNYNPVGLYRKTFTLPNEWINKQVFLNLEAASSVSFVWVNGQQVGYNAGAFEPSEYNISPYLKQGSNNISVQVFKYSAGTYLEDQDFWRLSGIFRDVYLIATPDVHFSDFFSKTDLDDAYKDALLTVVATIKNNSNIAAENCKVEASLIDKQQKNIYTSLHNTVPIVSSNGYKSVALEMQIDNPLKWTSETPELYTLVLKLLDATGNVIEIVTKRIGFREISLQHQALLVNGAPVKLNGVNSHMQHPVLGHAMDVETMREDLLLMKQFNINCVRTSHYPPNKEYLDLADELGMYIVDETGDESHATEYLSEREEWKAAYLNRVERMVLRDRSHPCIIFWSAGNESGFGKNICEVIKAGKQLDSTRLWMYGGNTDDAAWANEVPCEEIIGPRYPTPAELKYRIANVPESQDPRPSFMDEYIAATGNGLGGLDEYWDIIWESPRVIGGAIWDWVSPGLQQKVRLLKDSSANKIITSINGRAQPLKGKNGFAVQLNGYDQWIDVYRDASLDITTDQLTISLQLHPQSWNGNGSFVTKGSNQYGLIQKDKDSLQFYVGTPAAGILNIKIPADWYSNWHQLVAIYNGSSMSIYIDGRLAGQKAQSGNIINRPFPVNLGRNAELIGQEYTSRHSNAIFDELLISDRVIPADQLLHVNDSVKTTAILSLDFNKIEEKGSFFSLGNDARSYGLVWPDRRPQPELWQVKKSAQPLHAKMINADKGIVEITNRHRFTNLNAFETTWQLLANEQVIQQGSLALSADPMKSIQTQIPFKAPATIIQGVEYQLLISLKTKESKPWADKGFEVAWEAFTLPYKVVVKEPFAVSTSRIYSIEKKDTLLITGTDFQYAFDKVSGKLVSLTYKDKQLIHDGPALNVWRAPLANELDAWGVTGANLTYSAGMGNDVANGWRTLGLDDLKYSLDKFAISQPDSNRIIIQVSCHSTGVNYKTIFEEQYTYTISGNGIINIQHHILPQGFMPAWIPCIGTHWLINQKLNNVSWHGRGPFENYPDRNTGAKTSVYASTVKEMEEPYLVPQDYGLRTENRWVKLESDDHYGLEFKGEKWFDFSAQSISTDNLTRARYPFQLKPSGAITFNFNYATSGVGCTSISVLNQYRVAPAKLNYTYTIRPYSSN